MTLIRALALSLVALFALALPALACDTVVRQPEASVCTFGDPHATIRLDNSGSNVDVTFRVVYWTGRTDRRVVSRQYLDDGEVRSITRFVRGGDRKVSVYDDLTGALLVRVTVSKAPSC